MGEMAAGVAHELNQPLAAISTYAEGLCADQAVLDHLPDRLRQGLEQIHTQAQRAGRIIHSLRKFAQMGAPERTAVDANALVQEVWELTHADLQRHGVEAQLELAEELPRLFVAPIEIEQVLVNLLHNAAQAMSAAGCSQRRITLLTQQANDHQVRIVVRDTGPGLAADKLDRIFEPFYSTKDTGLGIGLNICQTLIEHHDGRIWAERNPDCGLGFHLLLPSEHAEPSHQTQPAPETGTTVG
jgi:C4-dicarboxylate-specific signal transduction histidine kinase